MLRKKKGLRSRTLRKETVYCHTPLVLDEENRRSWRLNEDENTWSRGSLLRPPMENNLRGGKSLKRKVVLWTITQISKTPSNLYWGSNPLWTQATQEMSSCFQVKTEISWTGSHAKGERSSRERASRQTTPRQKKTDGGEVLCYFLVKFEKLRRGVQWNACPKGTGSVKCKRVG